MKQASIIEVTNCENGYSRKMTRKEFDAIFGKEEGKELLAGYHPAVVAVEVQS